MTNSTKSRTKSDTLNELAQIRENAEALAQQAARLEKSLRSVKGTREIKARIIDPERPYFVGPDADTDHLYDAVKRAISTPDVRGAKTLRELVELTGETNRNRIGGALIKFQVEGLPVKNVGTRYRALWWLQPRKQTV